MQIILLENVQNLGQLGDSVTVKPGYARNFLIPQGRAIPATDANLARFEARRAELEKEQAAVLQTAGDRAEAIAGQSVTVARKAGDEGRLFGSVSAQDIAEAAQAAGMDIKRQEVRLAESIRQIGEYQVQIHLHGDVEASLLVRVETEN